MTQFLQLATDPIDFLGVMIPIIALMIPIVAIWTKHKYALEELRMKQHGATSKLAEDVDALRQDVRELRDHLHQQMIAVDNLVTNRPTAQDVPGDVPKRLGIGEQ